MNRNAQFALIVAGALFGLNATADCRPVIDAFEKSGKQARVAAFEVESATQAPTGAPQSVRINGVYFEREESGAYERIGANADSKLSSATWVNKLRETAKKGAQCVSAGSGSLRGASVVKYSFDNPFMPAMPANAPNVPQVGFLQQMRRMTIWVDNSSGLVLYTQAGSIGGDVFVYGSEVKDPAPVKRKK
jgi:hypothetical protein